MSRDKLQGAIERLEKTRVFSAAFLEGLTPDEWFWCPSGVTTHVAWQVGHLAVAQYNLCLRRVRGRTAADDTLMPESFVDRFKAGSKPAAGAENNLPLEEIQQRFESVFRQSLTELAERTDEDLNVPTEPPHPRFHSKLEAVSWASLHEMVHAGQIALLRRLMGKPPLR
jgi:DinB superfamily